MIPKFAVVVAVAGLSVFSRANDIVKWDSRLAVENALTDTNGVKWIDGRFLPIEGRAFDDAEKYYDRLPACVTKAVNAGVRGLKHHTAGMQFRFRTDSRFLVFKWTPYFRDLAPANNLSKTAASGIDIYRRSRDGKWHHLAAGGIDDPAGREMRVSWTPGHECLVYLPTFNGIRSFSLGVEKVAKVEALAPRKSGIFKPVVFYGTSITHGIAASRAGLTFVNIVGRDLDVPVVNLGFSGSGRMELEMSDHLSRIDASCYVLDCLTNMDGGKRPKVKDNYEPFIRNLRRLRPDVPIVMAGMPDVRQRGPNGKDRFVKSLYDRLVAEGWKNLVWLPKEEMFTDDFDGTVDGTHANDYGMTALAKGYGDAVRKALRLSVPSAQQ